jgi:hypothetical protein
LDSLKKRCQDAEHEAQQERGKKSKICPDAKQNIAEAMQLFTPVRAGRPTQLATDLDTAGPLRRRKATAQKLVRVFDEAVPALADPNVEVLEKLRRRVVERRWTYPPRYTADTDKLERPRLRTYKEGPPLYSGTDSPRRKSHRLQTALVRLWSRRLLPERGDSSQVPMAHPASPTATNQTRSD